MNKFKLVLAITPILLSFNALAGGEVDEDFYKDKYTQLLNEVESAKAPWNITSNLFFEIEKFDGHVDADGNSVTDKQTPVAQLFLRNPESAWSYFLEYKVAMRNFTNGLESTDNSFQRNRMQIGVTRKIVKNENVTFNLNATFRKESNDAAPGKDARGAYNLYWVMPSGSVKITDKLAFSYWDAFYYYDHFGNDNSTEWEAEHGVVYQATENVTAKMYLYNDWTWDDSGEKTWEQNQIRGYFPSKINDTWTVMPYFRYFLSEKHRDANYNVVNKNDNGLRLGMNIYFNATSKSTFWMGLAYENTDWAAPKGAGLTSGSDNTQKFYLGQIGWKYKW